MYTIVCEDTFDSAHKLIGYEGKCKNLHGHTWRYQVKLSFISKLDSVGISVDFKKVKELLKGLSDSFDHKLLNDLIEKPTAENISKEMYEILEAKIKEEGLSLIVDSISLWETPDNCIVYSKD